MQFFHQYLFLSFAAQLSNWEAPAWRASALSSSSESFWSLSKTLSTFTRMISTTWPTPAMWQLEEGDKHNWLRSDVSWSYHQWVFSNCSIEKRAKKIRLCQRQQEESVLHACLSPTDAIKMCHGNNCLTTDASILAFVSASLPLQLGPVSAAACGCWWYWVGGQVGQQVHHLHRGLQLGQNLGQTWPEVWWKKNIKWHSTTHILDGIVKRKMGHTAEIRQRCLREDRIMWDDKKQEIQKAWTLSIYKWITSTPLTTAIFIFLHQCLFVML